MQLWVENPPLYTWRFWSFLYLRTVGARALGFRMQASCAVVEQNCVGTSRDKEVPDIKIPLHVPWIRQQNSVRL